MDCWYNLTKQFIKLDMAVCIKGIHIIGDENLAPGPDIIAANHTSLTDGFGLPLITQEKHHFLILSGTVELPIVSHLLKKIDLIPVPRGRGQVALKLQSYIL